MSSWIEFLKAHKGQGYSKPELSQLYQESKKPKRKAPAKRKKVTFASNETPKAPAKKTAPIYEDDEFLHSVVVVQIEKSGLETPEIEIYNFSTREQAEREYKSLTGKLPRRERSTDALVKHRISPGMLAFASILIARYPR